MAGLGTTRAKVALALAVLLPVGYLTLDAVDVVPGVLTSDWGHEDTPSALPAGAGESPGVAPTQPSPKPTPGADGGLGAPGGLSAPSQEDPAPTRAGLAAALTPLLADPALGGSVGVEVRDGRTGTVLFGSSAAAPRTPASATKVLTAVGVAGEDLSQRFETRAVAVDADTVALVAGGDSLLAAGAGDPGAVVGQAGLADLAEAAAQALGPRTTPVRVVLDDSFARGPALAPGWEKKDVALGLTGPVAMLGLGTDRAVPYRPASADPALLATSTFAQALSAAGIPVQGRPTRLPKAAPAGAIELAAVHSAPVADVLALALDESDNDLTETVSRWACARAGAPTTFAGCAGWIRDRMADAGLDVSQVRLADTSGLSGGTRVPAAVVAAAVTLGADPYPYPYPDTDPDADPDAAGAADRSGATGAQSSSGPQSASAAPASATGDATDDATGDATAAPAGATGDRSRAQLAQVLAQLPVAGLTGTLSDRFLAPPARTGVGVVRAKTGTLTGVSALAGTVVDAQGRLLTFAVLADRVPAGGTSAARLALDRLAATLASCGCR